MDTRTHLPPEVIAQITECLHLNTDKQDLLNLAQTSRACRMESQRVLFREMDVGRRGGISNLENTQAAVLAHILFLDAITRAPLRLGQYVRSYTCIGLAIAPVDTDIHSNESLTHWQNLNRSFNRPNLKYGMRLWNKMHQAFPFMTRLEHLTLAIGNVLEFGHSTNGISILRNCRFALKSLVWGNALDFPTLAADVFPHQPSISSFGISHDVEDPPVPTVADFSAGALMHLVRIKGPSSAVLACLPGRNVDAVSWILQSDHETFDLPGQLFNRIRYLCMSGSGGLNNISGQLVSVEVLCLKTYSFNWNPDFSQLASLVSLRILILQNQGRWNLFDDDDMDNAAWWDSVEVIAATAFGACPTLECVLVEDPSDSWTYFTVKRAGDAIESGDDLHLSEMREIFQPWMPRPLTNFADIYRYM